MYGRETGEGTQLIKYEQITENCIIVVYTLYVHSYYNDHNSGMVDPLRGLLAELVTITLVSVRSSGTLSDHADLIDCFYAMLSQVTGLSSTHTGTQGQLEA